MFLQEYNESLSKGTANIVSIAKVEGLKEPECMQDDAFTNINYRTSTDYVTDQVNNSLIQKIIKTLLKIFQKFDCKNIFSLPKETK